MVEGTIKEKSTFFGRAVAAGDSAVVVVVTIHPAEPECFFFHDIPLFYTL